MSLILGLMSSVAYARLLGVENFGMLAIISAFAGLLSIASSYGQETATATFAAEAIGKKDEEAIKRTLAYFLQASAISIAVLLCLAAMAPFIAIFVRGDETIGQYARLALLNATLQAPNVLSFLALQFERKIGRITLIENGIDALQLALSIFFITLGWNISGVLWGTLMISAIAMPFHIYWYEQSARRQHLPSLFSLVPQLWFYKTGELFRQGFWITLDRNVGSNLYPNLFYLLLGKYGSLRTIAYFRIAFRLANLPTSLLIPSITRMTAIAIPRIAATDSASLLKACRRLLIGTLGLSTVAIAGAAIIVPPLIHVYGQEYTAATPIFLLLLPINFLMAAHVISVPILRVARRTWSITVVNILSILLGIGSFYILYPRLNAVYAVCVSIIIFHLTSLLVFLYLAHILKHWKPTSTLNNIQSKSALETGLDE
ncbi:MAG: hypothetical protein JWM56_769 [Candidatus Peribacteria bacterium]|nr:hypothetical protein [Candidatus Peribacteria bacterium]